MYRKIFLATAAIMSSVVTISAKEVLQTQYSKDGVEVDLVRAKVSGEVLSVVLEFHLTSPNDRVNITYFLDEVHYIDDMESKKYHVLKDEKGEWLSGPLVNIRDHHSPEQDIKAATEVVFKPVSQGGKEASRIVWYKFPAPPQGVKYIQINIPEVSPFDDVALAGVAEQPNTATDSNTETEEGVDNKAQNDVASSEATTQ